MKLCMVLAFMAMVLPALAGSALETVTSDLTLPSHVIENMVTPSEPFLAGIVPGTSPPGTESMLDKTAEDGTMLSVKTIPSIKVAGLLHFKSLNQVSSAPVIPKRGEMSSMSAADTSLLENSTTLTTLLAAENGTTTTVASATWVDVAVTPTASSSAAGKLVVGVGRPNTPTTLTHTVSMTVGCGPTNTLAMEIVTATYKYMTTAFWTLYYPGMKQAMLISTASTSTSTTIFETSSFNDSSLTTAPAAALTEPVVLTTVGMDPIYTITVVQEGTFNVEGGRRMHWATTAEETKTDSVWPFSASSVTIPAVATFPAETNTA
ncbi:hypothetical protein IWX90DRAFT_436409 [Phyllosticta citrichinensis]|uniref:Uncharacterized protein n=1 Tax=Phyllosticta citrichinensis TaxID=1130410 RepID=A0ABR1XRE2_9PEZI